MPPVWPLAKAQAALGDAALRLLEVLEALEVAKAALPLPPDLADRLDHRRAYDVAADLIGTIECVIEDCLRPAIRSLGRSAMVTEEELRRDFRKPWWRR